MTTGAGTDPRVASDYFPITKSDTVTFERETAGVYIGGAGDITVKKRNGTTCLFTACPVGLILPINCVGVMATGTSATNMVGLI